MKDHSLRADSFPQLEQYHELPPIRAQKIQNNFSAGELAKFDRIKSSEYDKWDKYDAGTKYTENNCKHQLILIDLFLSLIASRYRMHENGFERGAES